MNNERAKTSRPVDLCIPCSSIHSNAIGPGFLTEHCLLLEHGAPLEEIQYL